MKNDNLYMNWSLKELYSSFDGDDFTGDIKLLNKKADEAVAWSKSSLKEYNNPLTVIEYYINCINDYKNLSGKLSAFASLSFAADAKNNKAQKYIGLIEKVSAKITEVNVQFSKWLSKVPNLDELIDSSELTKEHKFHINEIIKNNKYLLTPDEEVIIAKMTLTSSSAWARFKNQIASNLKVNIEIDGKEEFLGITKIKNMAFSSDKELRKKAFYAENKNNENIAEGVAAALNGIKGEVLTICDLKDYKSPLQKTLEDSRMDEETLNTMLSVIKENLGIFKDYFHKKANLLGYEGKLPYYDIMAPVGNKDMFFTYGEAENFIEKHFCSFSEEMGTLARTAFKNRWIDAEVRDGKRGGAFCHNLHSIGESRILCSFNGSFKNVCTLAHELGHAYHGMILQKESPINSSYPMPLAETASIFSESLVRRAAIKIADREEKIAILGTELVNCSSVIVDIYARFLFEQELFNRRKDGELSLDEIKELMIWAEKEAYGDAICEDTFDPYAWIHKPHYYYAERNFYNFPYAFGLLFSKGLYNLYLKDGQAFIDKYNKVLKLSGQASIYDVGKYVGIDLHDKGFFQGSMDSIKDDIDKFCNINL